MKISSLLREAPGGPALSLDNDLMQRAMLRFPGYDSQQALSLYIADKATQQQKTDAAQNNLINTQQNAIKSIGQELQDYEAQAQETDREVERLKQLSGTLTTGSADRQQKAKVSADELEKLQKDLQDLKSKPGMDPEKYKEIEQQISALANSSGAEDADVKKLQNLVNNIQTKTNVNYDAVAAQLEKTKQDLDSKEERFKKYVKDTGDYKATTSKELEKMAKTSAAEIKKYSDIVDGYKTKIDGFDKYMNTKAKEIEDMSNELSSTIRFAKPLIRQSSAIAAQNAIGNAQSSSQSASQNNTGYELPDIEPEEVENQMDLSLDSDVDGDNTTTNKNESKIFELENRPIGPVLEWDQKTEEWLKQYLPIFVKDFKKKYNVALGNKHPTYNDHQIAYAIENHITDLFAQKENPITRSTLNNFFSWVKDDLFQQPPETSTVHMKQKAQDNLFSESLDKTYSRMLDNLIGLPYIKG
jgi:chromosome segregation ATPase